MSRMAVSDAEALLYACPQCKQTAGDPCVYVPIVLADLNSRSAAVQEKLRKVGTPTVKVHNERRRVVHAIHKRKFRQQLKQAQLRKSARQRKVSVWEALSDFDRQETMRLRAWLYQHGSVLWR